MYEPQVFTGASLGSMAQDDAIGQVRTHRRKLNTNVHVPNEKDASLSRFWCAEKTRDTRENIGFVPITEMTEMAFHLNVVEEQLPFHSPRGGGGRPHADNDQTPRRNPKQKPNWNDAHSGHMKSRKLNTSVVHHLTEGQAKTG